MTVLLLGLLLRGCVKYPCVTVIPATYKCKNPELIRFIEINFFQGPRVVRADVIYGDEFKDGIFNREYDFADTSPDLMIWRVFHVNRSGWTQYETKIK